MQQDERTAKLIQNDWSTAPSRINQTKQNYAALRTAQCIAEQEFLPAHDKGLDAAFARFFESSSLTSGSR